MIQTLIDWLAITSKKGIDSIIYKSDTNFRQFSAVLYRLIDL